MAKGRYRVAVVGGVREETLPGLNPEQQQERITRYRQQCEELGTALADADLALLVWSSDQRFVEGDVVRGYLKGKNVAPGSILCVWDKGHEPMFPGPQEEGGPFVRQLAPHGDWEVGFYESLKAHADAVVLIGGGPTTLVAGVVAASWGKAIFAVPEFSGKAETLHKWLHTRDAAAHVLPEDLDAMSRPWSSRACVASLQTQLQRRAAEEAAAEQKAATAKAERETLQAEVAAKTAALAQLSAGEKRALWVFLLLGALVASLLFAVSAQAGAIRMGALFLLLAFGGAVGTVTNGLWAREWRRSNRELMALGMFAGIAVGLVEVFAQAVGDGGVDALGATHAFRGTVFALFAGFSLEATFERFRARAAGESTEPTASPEKTPGEQKAA